MLHRVSLRLFGQMTEPIKAVKGWQDEGVTKMSENRSAAVSLQFVTCSDPVEGYFYLAFCHTEPRERVLINGLKWEV